MSNLTISPALEAKFAQIARAELGPAAERLGPDTPLSEVGDSLDWLALLSAVEDAFSVRITNEQSRRLRTVGDLLSLLEEPQHV